MYPYFICLTAVMPSRPSMAYNLLRGLTIILPENCQYFGKIRILSDKTHLVRERPLRPFYYICISSFTGNLPEDIVTPHLTILSSSAII